MARKVSAAPPPARGARPRNVQHDPNGVEDRLTQERPQQALPILIASIALVDAEVSVTIDEFKGNLTVDLRLYEPFSAAAVPMPTRKGVTLGLRKLPELARALADAEATARELGLL